MAEPQNMDIDIDIDNHDDFPKKFIEKTISFPSDTSYVSYNTTGSLMAAGCISGVVRIFNTEDDYSLVKEFNHPTFPNPDERELYQVRRVGFSENGDLFFINSFNHLVIYKTDDYTPVFTLSDIEKPKDAYNYYYNIVFNDTSDKLAICMKNSVRILDITAGFTPVETIQTNGKISNFIFMEDKYIIGAWDNDITIVKKDTHELLASRKYIEKDQDHIMHMIILKPQNVILCCYYAHKPEILNIADLSVIASFDIAYPVFFKGKQLNEHMAVISGGIWGYTLINIKTYTVIDAYTTYVDAYGDTMIEAFFRDFDPSGKYIALCDNSNINLLLTPPHAIKHMADQIESAIKEQPDMIPELANVDLGEEALAEIAVALF